jgi:hypothetical protein
MKAITDTGIEIKDTTLRGIKRQMDRMLDVAGPRGLSATTDTGATIHTELYEGQDRITDARGRVIYSNARK